MKKRYTLLSLIFCIATLTLPARESLNFTIPYIHIEFESPKTISSPLTNLKKELNKPKKPKIFVRIPKKCGEAEFISTIESKLTTLGLDVLDHTLTEGTTNPTTTAREYGANIMLDVSWLEFSHPDMSANLKRGANKVLGYLKIFPPHLDFESLKAINREVINELESANCFAKNMKTVSAQFKFIDLSTGSILGKYHIGISLWGDTIELTPIEFSGSSKTGSLGSISNYKTKSSTRLYIRDPSSNYISWIDAWNKERYNTYYGSIESAWILTAIGTDLHLEEYPFAEKLNKFEPEKIQDEQIVETVNSSSSTNSDYHGYGRTNYYRRYNRSHWSGNSESNTSSSSTRTTTFRDAIYIKPEDFYHYYAPLTDKLCAELRKLLSGNNKNRKPIPKINALMQEWDREAEEAGKAK